MTPEDRSRFIEKYTQRPEALRHAYDLAPDEMRDWRPVPEEWSVNEIIHHCADAELNAAVRIRMLIADPHPRIIAVDQDEWVRAFDYSSNTIDDAFAVIDSTRRWTAPLLTRIPEDGWTKSGHHSESGDYTSDDWLAVYGPHLHGHVDQIEANIEAWTSRAETAS